MTVTTIKIAFQRNVFRITVWLVFLTISLLLFWPWLLSPAFSMVDDGYVLMKGRDLVTKLSVSEWSQILVETNVGRFRPIYLLFYSFMYLLFQTHPIGLWFGQLITLWISLGILFELLWFITGKKVLAATMSLVWLVMPTIAENVFRLGPTEPRQVLSSLLAILFLLQFEQKKVGWKLGLSLFFAFLALGTKETSIFLIPFYGLFLFKPLIKKIHPLFLFGGMALVAGVTIIGGYLAVLQWSPSGYAVVNFGVTIDTLKERIYQSRINYAHYYLLLWVGLICISARALLAIWGKKFTAFINQNFLSAAFLLLIFESIFFTVAWAFQFERYFYPTWTFMIIFLGMESMAWWQLVEKGEHQKLSAAKSTLLVMCAIVLMAAGVVKIFSPRSLNYSRLMLSYVDTYQRSYDAVQIEHQVIAHLLENKTATVLYTTNDDYEVIYEMGLYVSQLRARDVTVISTNKILPELETGFQYHPDPLTAYYLDPRQNKVLVGRIRDVGSDGVPPEAVRLNPTLKYDVMKTDLFWWMVDPESSSASIDT